MGPDAVEEEGPASRVESAERDVAAVDGSHRRGPAGCRDDLGRQGVVELDPEMDAAARVVAGERTASGDSGHGCVAEGLLDLGERGGPGRMVVADAGLVPELDEEVLAARVGAERGEVPGGLASWAQDEVPGAVAQAVHLDVVGEAIAVEIGVQCLHGQLEVARGEHPRRHVGGDLDNHALLRGRRRGCELDVLDRACPFPPPPNCADVSIVRAAPNAVVAAMRAVKCAK